MALAVVLLVGAGLMIRSVRNLVALDPGFDPRVGADAARQHSARTVAPPRQRRPPRGAPAAPAPPPPVVDGRALLDRLRAVPGVAAAALGNDLPLDGDVGASFYSAEGQPAVNAQNVPRAYVHRVSPEFFATLRIPFVSGRTFTDAEAQPDVTAVIVSERVVQAVLAGTGSDRQAHQVRALTSSNPWLTIVGVVGEVKYRGLPREPDRRSGHLSAVRRSQRAGRASRCAPTCRRRR